MAFLLAYPAGSRLPIYPKNWTHAQLTHSGLVLYAIYSVTIFSAAFLVVFCCCATYSDLNRRLRRGRLRHRVAPEQERRLIQRLVGATAERRRPPPPPPGGGGRRVEILVEAEEGRALAFPAPPLTEGLAVVVPPVDVGSRSGRSRRAAAVAGENRRRMQEEASARRKSLSVAEERLWMPPEAAGRWAVATKDPSPKKARAAPRITRSFLLAQRNEEHRF